MRVANDSFWLQESISVKDLKPDLSILSKKGPEIRVLWMQEWWRVIQHQLPKLGLYFLLWKFSLDNSMNIDSKHTKLLPSWSLLKVQLITFINFFHKRCHFGQIVIWIHWLNSVNRRALPLESLRNEKCLKVCKKVKYVIS